MISPCVGESLYSAIQNAYLSCKMRKAVSKIPHSVIENHLSPIVLQIPAVLHNRQSPVFPLAGQKCPQLQANKTRFGHTQSQILLCNGPM